ncbi:hypothetical protein DVA86_13805 [Streptomyces armeniacus]|uniref:Uncharacterized protein n=1 Tax=Streptomyces armeniacus TaxID=83291 RepID=A0A345XPJ8_9ACTN|nr:hypothetical protein [Streptomyces armeniacus]AXK33564.1 hypothetical protein DVA86_13805 [Streptomyces armeniacus]
MHQPEPPPSLAPHIPADAYRRAEATGRPVVIVQTPAPAPRRSPGRYLVPLAVGTGTALGVLGVVAAVLALLQFAAETVAVVTGVAGPLGIGGITVKLARNPRD